MQDPYKAIALNSAIQILIARPDMPSSSALPLAKNFYAFLTGDIAPQAETAVPAAAAIKETKPTKTTKAPKNDKPAKTEEEIVEESISKAHKKAEKQDEAEEKGATLEGIGTLIAELLSANLRKQTVALLDKFGAKSASGVKEEDYEEFVEEGCALLMAA